MTDNNNNVQLTNNIFRPGELEKPTRLLTPLMAARIPFIGIGKHLGEVSIKENNTVSDMGFGPSKLQNNTNANGFHTPEGMSFPIHKGTKIFGSPVSCEWGGVFQNLEKHVDEKKGRPIALVGDVDISRLPKVAKLAGQKRVKIVATTNTGHQLPADDGQYRACQDQFCEDLRDRMMMGPMSITGLKFDRIDLATADLGQGLEPVIFAHLTGIKGRTEGITAMFDFSLHANFEQSYINETGWGMQD